MTARRILWVLSLVILGFALNPAMPLARAQATAPAPASAGDAESLRAATVLTIHGTVTAVDKAQKLVTVQVLSGEKYTLKVDNPVNLDAASVGTGVVVRYYEAVTCPEKEGWRVSAGFIGKRRCCDRKGGRSSWRCGRGAFESGCFSGTSRQSKRNGNDKRSGWIGRNREGE